jgi:hypothetical protein
MGILEHHLSAANAISGKSLKEKCGINTFQLSIVSFALNKEDFKNDGS